VLADISGYTQFLDTVRAAHASTDFDSGEIPMAYAMMSNLLNGIAASMDPPLTLVKFEGDAVFAVSSDGTLAKGAAMVECIRRCYQNFKTRLDEAGAVWTCGCGACGRKGTLDLKFVIHHGEYFVQALASHVDVVGPDVIIAHRLLKNSAAGVIGSTAYGLFTDPAANALDLPLDGAPRLTEPIDGEQTIGARVIGLSA
jgi:class 3 adenylate cyclase